MAHGCLELPARRESMITGDPRWHAARAELLRRAGRDDEAVASLTAPIDRCRRDRERTHLVAQALRSVEADVAALADEAGSHADLIDGRSGQASLFRQSFGFYVQGVVAETAVLPAGRRDRLVRYQSPTTGGVVAWCLELHDRSISKAIAGRPKDREFCRARLEAGHVDRATLTDRFWIVTDLDPAIVRSVERLVTRAARFVHDADRVITF